MLTDSFVSTNRRAEFSFAFTNRRGELYLDKDKSNADWGGYRSRCDIDLGVEYDILIGDVFLDRDEDEVDILVVTNTEVCKIRKNDVFSLEVNSFLGTSDDWAEEAEIELFSALGDLGSLELIYLGGFEKFL